MACANCAERTVVALPQLAQAMSCKQNKRWINCFCHFS